MKNNKAASNIATVAIFFAIMLVINFLTSLVFNLWPVPIKPTLIHVPVIIASIVYGPRIGATLGALMGVISVTVNTLTLLSIMYTAALSNASQELKEAAMLDGANLIQQIRTVEWPAIKDMVVIQFILQAGNIMSIGFEKAYALQTDLNLNSAEIIATYVYKKGLLDGDYSFSTAVGLFNTVINVILLIAVNKVVAKMNDGQGL